ncbi:MAG: hypothetical protein MUE56_07970, partial [Ignavibacteria bacterium]|nr:hypothetical protein [Ignavibacteria bacterium]
MFNYNISAEIASYNSTWLDFDGVNDKMIIQDDSKYSMNNTGNQITISFWMKMDDWAFTGQDADSNYINLFQKKTYDGDDQCEWEFRIENSTGLDGTSYRPCRISFYSFNSTCGLGAGAFIQNNLTANSCEEQMVGQWIHVVGGVEPSLNVSFVYVNGIKNALASGNYFS